MYNCEGCNKEMKAQKDYEHEHCCSGFECGCMGLPINPIFCDKCEESLFGKQID